MNNKFNTPESLLVVTSYPDPEKGIRDLNAVAWHAKKTLRALALDKKIVVLAEKIKGETVYRDGKNLLVERIWQKNHPASLFSVFKEALDYNQVKNIFFQFEFNIFGGIMPVIFLPLLLLFLKLIRKNIYFEMHQVVFDIKVLEKHINVSNHLLQKIFNLGLRYLYFMIGIFSTQIIVFEEELRFRLGRIINTSKITTLPLAVENKKTIPTAVAKQQLGYAKDDFVVLMFGFVNWYKGSDWIADAFTSIPDRRTKLLLAGGPNPTLKHKKYYENYFRKIRRLAKQNTNIKLTGFVPDNKVAGVFSAADLVIFPYRVFMSASGPFSLAVSYRKPVIISETLSKYARSEDVALALEQSGLKTADITFKLEDSNLYRILLNLKKHPKNLLKLKKFISFLAAKRKTPSVAKNYTSLLFPAPAVAVKPHYQSLFHQIFAVGKLRLSKKVE